MKSKMMMVLSVLFLVIGVAALMAQGSNALPTDQSSAVTQTSTTSSSDATQVQKPANCDRTGRGYGDGTKPRPQDGTGFGAKAGDRRNRNVKMGKGLRKGPQNGQGKRMCNGSNNCQGCQGQGRGQRLRLRKRDGSCVNNSSTSPAASASQTFQNQK